jgi:hypothetical protein
MNEAKLGNTVESRTSLRLLSYLAVYWVTIRSQKCNGVMSYISRLTNEISKKEKPQETQQAWTKKRLSLRAAFGYFSPITSNRGELAEMFLMI